MKQQANIKYCFKPRITAGRLAAAYRNEAVLHIMFLNDLKDVYGDVRGP
jgi:hypothetical protein